MMYMYCVQVTRTSSVTNNEVAAFDSALPDTSDAPAASSHHAVQVTDTAVVSFMCITEVDAGANYCHAEHWATNH